MRGGGASEVSLCFGVCVCACVCEVGAGVGCGWVLAARRSPGPGSPGRPSPPRAVSMGAGDAHIVVLFGLLDRACVLVVLPKQGAESMRTAAI